MFFITKGILCSAILLYLCVQSYSDMKTMRVYTFLNNAAVVLSCVFLIIGYIVTGTLPNSEIFPGLLCILLFLIFKMYGKGDIKAMIAMFLSSAYFGQSFSQPNSFAFLIGLFIGNVLFFLTWKVHELVTKSRRKKAAFFPYLIISYVAMFLTCRL